MSYDCLKDEMKKHALEEVPKECCGLIIKSDKLEAVRCPNLAAKPEKRFLIPIEETIAAQAKGLVAFYHSHPNGGDFSMLDRIVAEKWNLDCVLYDCKSDEVKTYSPSGYQAPYVGRPFLLGVFDCFTLAQDYYSRELNLSLPEINHDLRMFRAEEIDGLEADKIKEYDTHPLTSHFLNNGFVKVKTLNKHDIILTRTTKRAKSATNVLVHIGNEQVLSQGTFSRVKFYDGAFKAKTVDILRHRKLV